MKLRIQNSKKKKKEQKIATSTSLQKRKMQTLMKLNCVTQKYFKQK